MVPAIFEIYNKTSTWDPLSSCAMVWPAKVYNEHLPVSSVPLERMACFATEESEDEIYQNNLCVFPVA